VAGRVSKWLVRIEAYSQKGMGFLFFGLAIEDERFTIKNLRFGLCSMPYAVSSKRGMGFFPGVASDI
jgi:hypothetical protein